MVPSESHGARERFTNLYLDGSFTKEKHHSRDTIINSEQDKEEDPHILITKSGLKSLLNFSKNISILKTLNNTWVGGFMGHGANKP